MQDLSDCHNFYFSQLSTWTEQMRDVLLFFADLPITFIINIIEEPERGGAEVQSRNRRILQSKITI